MRRKNFVPDVEETQKYLDRVTEIEACTKSNRNREKVHQSSAYREFLSYGSKFKEARTFKKF